jgi:hypothetical protein
MNNKNTIVKILIFTSVILSTLIFSVGSFTATQSLDSPIYSSKSIIDVGNYLRTEVNVGDVILAPFDESNVLPAYVPIKVITGHGPESKNLSVISEILDRFYNGDLSQGETQDFIQSFDIKFIVVPGDIDPSRVMSQFELHRIKTVYENIDYLVLKIDDK